MKIVYYPAGSRAFASSRLRVWKIGDALLQMGHEVSYNTDPFEADVIVIQKRTDLYSIMQQAKAKGIQVVFDVDDWIANLGVECASVTTVDTLAKLDLYPGAVVIPDALDITANAPLKTAHADKLKTVVWSGNAENAYHVRSVAEACRLLGLDLVVITDIGSPSYAHFDGVTGLSWSVDTVDEQMIQADLAVCPFVFDGTWSNQWVASKSANKLMKAWSLGLPVVGTPIPSYLEAGLQYCATSVHEWVEALATLANDPAARCRDAQRGRAIALATTADKVALQWLDVFNDTNGRSVNEQS